MSPTANIAGLNQLVVCRVSIMTTQSPDKLMTWLNDLADFDCQQPHSPHKWAKNIPAATFILIDEKAYKSVTQATKIIHPWFHIFLITCE